MVREGFSFVHWLIRLGSEIISTYVFVGQMRTLLVFVSEKVSVTLARGQTKTARSEVLLYVS